LQIEVLMTGTAEHRRSFHAFSRAALALLAGLATLAGHAADLAPLEPGAAPGSMAPEVAALPDGSFAVVSWLEPVEGGHALRFARFDGRRFGDPDEIARGGDWFVNWADTPRVFVDADERWTAHWLQRAGDPTYAYHVHYARTRDAGRTWTPGRRLHADDSPTEHGFVSYFDEPGERVSAVWLDGRRTGADEGAMMLRTAIAEPADAGITLDSRVCDCCQTAAATTASGPVVVYRDRSVDEIRDIAIVRRVDGQWTAPRRVHADDWQIAGCPVNGPDVAAAGNTVVVAWFTMAGDTPRVRMAVSGDGGETFEAPTALSTGNALGRVQVVRHGSGFVATWMDETEYGAVLRLAQIDAEGRARRGRDVLSLAGGRVSGFPRIASVGGRILVAWTETLSEADGGTSTRVRAGLVDPAPG
jgi:hypothetical protein